ncbi:protein phosphatase 2C 38 isoform X2 [Gracilaria domingensis]|nr:protein phosphatase 2C 38 isoform X2 [Gracilaria domingensis]
MLSIAAFSRSSSHRLAGISAVMDKQSDQQPQAEFPQVGSFITPGTRGRAFDYQHDRYVCYSDEHATVLAVFDGHGRPHNGHLISHHCATSFLPYLQKHPAWSEPNIEREEADPAMTTALSNVVAQLENDSLKITDSTRQFAGTTLCAVVLKDGFLYTANVGDSRAVLGLKSTSDNTPLDPLQLTTDHNCTNPLERQRIESNGGVVLRNRLNGDLDMSRTIGDHEFKKYRNQVRFNRSDKLYGDQLLISTPDISSRKLDGQEVVLVVATDGLWIPTLQNDLILVIAYGMLQRGKGANKVAKGLSQFAMGSGSTDNITILVAVLNRVEKSERRHAFQELRARRRLRKNGLTAAGTAAAPGEDAQDGTTRRGSRVRSLFSKRHFADNENTVHNAHEFDDLVPAHEDESGEDDE